jgi:hypothetical protein
VSHFRVVEGFYEWVVSLFIIYEKGGVCGNDRKKKRLVKDEKHDG